MEKHSVVILFFILALLAAKVADCQSTVGEDQIQQLLNQPLLDPIQPLNEFQVNTGSLVPATPLFTSRDQWLHYAENLRSRILNEVILRGEASKWAADPVRIEWLGESRGGPGYGIRKLRFEAVPGLWIPALLYEPEELTGKVPAVLNVNGHYPDGKAVELARIRCINQAKRG